MKSWISPPKQNADFVYHLEQVLAVYERLYNEQFPVVCVDESPKQLIEITRYRATEGTRIEDSDWVAGVIHWAGRRGDLSGV